MTINPYSFLSNISAILINKKIYAYHHDYVCLIVIGTVLISSFVHWGSQHIDGIKEDEKSLCVKNKAIFYFQL
jgi:hypothetical protein